ncbi:MAG: hypothetical protein FJY85_20625 [Deltaproteobacteria bacterium]|nr:hypothetical protein [Deltaproteobacteria bacterium]
MGFEDRTTKSSLAVEFKPPGQPKREYVTGLGQSLTYLRDFEFSALIVPEQTEDRFPIADYFKECLEEEYATQIPIGLFAYAKDPSNPGDLHALVPLRNRSKPLNRIPQGVGRSVFWSYWRDLSNHDLLFLLGELSRGRGKTFEDAYRRYWSRLMTKGRALTWERNPRKAKEPDAPSFSAERLNSFLSVRHIGLVDASGNITEDGLRLARFGDVYGADSAWFLNSLANRVLIHGRHLELIFWVDEQQRRLPLSPKRNAGDFYAALDRSLQQEGIIARVPDGSGKPTFLRDEQKLWNKLSLLVPSDRQSYFHSGVGLVFNWRNIISAVNRDYAGEG